MQFINKLNTPVMVAVVLFLVLAVNSFLLYHHQQSLHPTSDDAAMVSSSLEGGSPTVVNATDTQEETTQQATSEALQSTTSSGDLAVQLVGTWENTSKQGKLVPPGTQVLTFYPDGTLKSTSSEGSADANFTARYSILDSSHIRFTLEDGGTLVADYTLDGATLRVNTPASTGTFRRTGA